MPAKERVKKSFVLGTSRNQNRIGPEPFQEHPPRVVNFFTRSNAGIQQRPRRSRGFLRTRRLDPRFRGGDKAQDRSAAGTK